MKTVACARAWQAEALEDGRLPSSELASFQRHAETCAVCKTELRALTALREVSLSLPVLASKPLERRRQRHELLRRANALTVRSPGVFPLRALGWGAGLTALACLVLFLLRAPSSEKTSASRAQEVPTFRMWSASGASLRTVQRGATLRLAADRGQFEIAVDKLHAGQRFVLELPDGELEVKGTRFVVDVAPAGTRQVRVSEGRVVLRLRDDGLQDLRAGQSWSRPSPEPVSPAPESRAAGSGTVAAGARDGVRRPHAPSNRTPSSDSASSPKQRAAAEATENAEDESPASSANHAPSSAGASFAAAMTAFSAGDYAKAQLLFARFERDHPGDSRGEDALFLRAVAFARQGDTVESRRHAGEYLNRYPDGLRRDEAERMAR